MKKRNLLFGFMCLGALLLSACGGGTKISSEQKGSSHSASSSETSPSQESKSSEADSSKESSSSESSSSESSSSESSSSESSSSEAEHVHTYEFDSFVWAETPGNYTAKAKYVCSGDVTHVELYDATMSKVDSEHLEPTCGVEGVDVWKASYDGHEETKNEVITALEHSYVDSGHGYTACSHCGLIQSLNQNETCNSPLISYFDKEVGDTTGLFGGWTTGKFKIAEKANEIIWLEKTSDAYSDQWFNANNTTDNWIYDVYLRTPDTDVTQCQLFFGANNMKYAVPVYSNGGINLWDDHNTHSFVDGAFKNFAFTPNTIYHLQMVYFELGSNQAQLTWIINNFVINSLVIDSIADQRNFGFDVSENANWQIGSPNIYIMHNCIDSGNGYSACACGETTINKNHKAGASLLTYEDKEVGATADLFGGWTTGNFKITEKRDNIVWLGKISDDYAQQWFNAGDDVQGSWVPAENWVYDVYLRTSDSGDVTQCQLFFGANNMKYAVPVYSNGGINLWDDHNTHSFVDGAFKTFSYVANQIVHIQLVYVEKGTNQAQLSYVINGKLIHTFAIDSIADQRNFGFDVSANANWQIGSPNIFVLD